MSHELDRSSNDESIEVVVLMKAQYDRTQLNRNAYFCNTKLERREFVVNELKAFSEASQYDLRHSLTEMEQQGLVTAPRVLWSANALYFSATKPALIELSKRTDIETISLNVQHPLIPEEETVRATSNAREITPNITQVNADQVWTLGYTGAGVVVAVNYNDAAADFTSQGPVTWQDTEFGDYAYNPGIGLIRPDVCAPGVNIKSLDYNNVNGYTYMDGTSQATPCVAGIVALMLQKNPELTPAQICQILEETSVKLTLNKSNITGVGRVDALAAINAVPAWDGISKNTLNVNIFPNPTQDNFTIQCDGMKQIEVYSIDGRLVKSLLVNGSECLIEGLVCGVYLLKIEKSQGTFTKKIVKM